MPGFFTSFRALFQWRWLHSWSPVIVCVCLACLPGIVQGQEEGSSENEEWAGPVIAFPEEGGRGREVQPIEIFGYILFGLVVLVLCTAYFYLWISQLVQLMVFTNDDFPGRADKTLWLIIYIFFSPIAPFIFMWWKKAYLHVRYLERKG